MVRPMPARLADIVAALDGLLEPERFADYCPNGLQVPGAEEVTTVATGVSAHVELFEGARAEGAPRLVLAHHGLFWGTGPGPIDAALARRLRVLFAADISLLAYHLPLDAHPEVGNNALLARALGAEPSERSEPSRAIAASRSAAWRSLRAGACRSPICWGGCARRRRRASRWRSISARRWCGARGDRDGRRAPSTSRGGAIAAGADAFITGEPAERVMAQAREAGVHFIAAGHYATETFGVRRLGEHLAERFGVRHVFLDFPNPV